MESSSPPTPPVLRIAAHPSALVKAFETRFPQPLGTIETAGAIRALLSREADAPLTSGDALRASVRAMLRTGDYKPTGRGKPASEYLLRAAASEPLPSINLAVDVCNAVSLHSGLPISVVDLDRARAPFTIRLGEPGERYVFNATGQEIELNGLLCLCDADGPCGNAVKDAQRTKTSAGTVRTLSVVWGTKDAADHLALAEAWYRSLLADVGASTLSVAPAA
jgi:DNA/RNA-binding domain of Phe-tRNA-synthetase-like protein